MKRLWVLAKYISCQGPFPLLSLIMSNCLGCDGRNIREWKERTEFRILLQLIHALARTLN